MAIVADSGAIYAVYDRSDRHHRAVVSCLRKLRTEVLVPAAILSEVGYLLEEWLGPKALLAFLADVESGSFQVIPTLPQDLQRCRKLLQQFASLKLGLADACVIAAAERLDIRQILTVDEQDFRAIPQGNSTFTLLPADLPIRP